jgi:hypothetical protein
MHILFLLEFHTHRTAQHRRNVHLHVRKSNREIASCSVVHRSGYIRLLVGQRQIPTTNCLTLIEIFLKIV